MIMRRLSSKKILRDNKGESIAEVMVAFLVLSIMMALFAQGLRYVGTARSYAIEECDAADTAMLELQKTINKANQGQPSLAFTTGKDKQTAVTGSSTGLVAHQYQVMPPSYGTDQKIYYYWVYEVQ